MIALAIGGVWASGVRLLAFPGESMIPAVRQGDYFVGLVGLWGHRSPQRFDMLICQYAEGGEGASKESRTMRCH